MRLPLKNAPTHLDCSSGHWLWACSPELGTRSGTIGRPRFNWMLDVAHAVVRAPRQQSARQRRWALLRTFAAETARAENRGYA